jgi:N-acetylglutamate synthase-like GNAT family acetyltransferase
MTHEEAEQIAALLNNRNQLVRSYAAADVLAEKDHYVYELREGKVVACVEHKQVQWYQLEVRHLSVAPAWERQGLGSMVYQRAEEFGRSKGACLVQCTIREGNVESEGFFLKHGFTKVGRFSYAPTTNTVGVWQKVLTVPRTVTA